MKKRVLIALAIGATLLAISGLAASASGPNWDVSGAWTGSSGLVGNLAYHFNMTLVQTDGIVTGSIAYTNAAPLGTIQGYVEGDKFYFTRTDTNQNYWATCWPCTISADGTYFHGYGVDSPGRAVEWEAQGQATRLVMIDIKPGSDPNCFNSDSHGVIPLAILGSADFDASTVDPFTVFLDGAQVRVKGKSGNAGSLEDVNGDGFQDLVVQILDDGSYTFGDTTATLNGFTHDGVPIVGTDTICIRPPE